MEMKNPLAVGLLALLVAAMAVTAAAHDDDDVPFTDEDLESEQSMWNLYDRWRAVYASSSSHLGGDIESRFEAFKANARYVSEFNKKEGMTYELGLNKFADMTLEEFVAKYAGAKVDAAAALASVPEAEEEVVGDVPAAWDWRQHGVVTPVKDQGSCGNN
jgi:KDEL-tailed cysteine endopeptidase